MTRRPKDTHMEDGSPAWHARRKEGLGGSDVAAVFGVSPFTSGAKLWRLKTGREMPSGSNRFTTRGSNLEDYVLSRFTRETGQKVHPGVAFVPHLDWGVGVVLQANTDGRLDDDRVFEAKTTGPTTKTATAFRGGKIPVYYALQLVAYCACVEERAGVISCLIGAGDPQQCDLISLNFEIDVDLVLLVEEVCRDWWRDYKVADVKPPRGRHPKADEMERLVAEMAVWPVDKIKIATPPTAQETPRRVVETTVTTALSAEVIEMPAGPKPDSAAIANRREYSVDLCRTLAGELAPAKLLGGVSEADALVKILWGREIGLAPIQALMSVIVIKGRATLRAGTIASLIKGSGRYTYRIRTQTARLCEIDFYEAGIEAATRISWSIEEARTAGLLGKDNWRQYPSDMLSARCLSRGARRVCPDIFLGPIYTPEELRGGQSFDAVEPAPTRVVQVVTPRPSGPVGTPPDLDTNAIASAALELRCRDIADLWSMAHGKGSKLYAVVHLAVRQAAKVAPDTRWTALHPDPIRAIWKRLNPALNDTRPKQAADILSTIAGWVRLDWSPGELGTLEIEDAEIVDAAA